MNSRNIFEIVRAKQLVSELSWRKRYANDTSLWEYKIYKYKSKSRKPIAFVQFGEYDNTGYLIGLSVTYANDIQNPIDCETYTQFEKALYGIIDKNMGIYQFVCESACDFLEKHYDELRKRPEDLGFRSKEDLFERVKNDPLDAIWCIRKIFSMHMGTDYCSQLFIENEEEDIYKATLNEETRYYKLEFDESRFDEVVNFVEVKKHTKLVPVVSWIPMNK
jgi:hypothetical protein